MTEFRKTPKVVVGLEFTSRHFSARAKIVAIREKENEVDVELMPSDGNAWVQKCWDLQHVKESFENGDYVQDDLSEQEKKRNDQNYHII